MFHLGDTVKDKITGFTGTVICRTEHRNNCDRYTLQATGLKNGQSLPAVSFDEVDLEPVSTEGRVEVGYPPFEFELDDILLSKFSGYQGIVTARASWIGKCLRYTLQAFGSHEGLPLKPECFDGTEVILVKKTEEKPEVVVQKTGGPRPEPSRR